MNHPPNNDNDNADNANDAAAPVIAAADADDDEDDAICQEALALLQNRLNFPARLRDRTMVQFAQQFVTNVKEDIHKMLTDTHIEEEGYDGLDSARDTEEEVATASRSCPEVLTQREDLFGLYPIQCVTFVQDDEDTTMIRNVKAVSFLPLFVQLAMEFNSFPNEERGGLLARNANRRNPLQDLMFASHSSYDDNHQQRVDTTFVAVLIQLRRSGYFVKNDIQHYGLVHFLCQQIYFPEQRFRFLSEWDPPSLLRTNVNNELPFHIVAFDGITLRSFRVVLDSLFRFYPRWKGINALFTLDNDGDTPFSLACKNLTRANVIDAVEEVLVRYTTNTGLVDGNNNDNNGNAMILAASKDTMSLDGLILLIRRQPNTMLSMVRHRNKTSNNNNNGTEDVRRNENNHNPGDNSTNDHGSNTNHSTVTVLRRSTGKRKRN